MNCEQAANFDEERLIALVEVASHHLRIPTESNQVLEWLKNIFKFIRSLRATLLV